jgi:hypothetical protein
MLPEAETRKSLSAEIDLVTFDPRTNSVGSFCKFTFFLPEPAHRGRIRLLRSRTAPATSPAG